jgi:hypothetical protein
MKKYILILVSFVFASNISAQSFGLKGGVAITNFIGSYADFLDAKSRTGVFVGAFMKLGEENIKWMPEVLFHQKGVETFFGSVVFNYLDLGVNGLFHINDELALAIGPYMGYAVSGTHEYGSITDWEYINRIEFGTNFGAIYNINDLLHLDLRYGIAFTDVSKEESVRNSSIQIGIGYVFGY